MLARQGHYVSVLFLNLLLPLSLHGQSADQGHDAPARNRIEVVGVATLADGSLEGTTVDRRLFLLGFAYSRLLTRNRAVEISFTSEAIPLALLREPFLSGTSFPVAASNPRFTEMRETYGAGASPVGIEMDWLPRKKIQPFFGVQGGFLYFDRNVLNFRAAQFNFTIDGRAGVRIELHQGKSISVAYMFQHMSNAYEATENPGLDTHMICVTYRFPSRFRRRAH